MPRSPVQLIDEDMNALRMLRKIAQNEAALHSMKRILRECFGGNGNCYPVPTEISPPPRRGAIWETNIKKNVLKVFPALHGRDFDYKDGLKALATSGYELAAKNPRTAIGGILRQLAAEGKLKLVKKGIAGNPSIYRVP
jgi:hypothetical protein